MKPEATKKRKSIVRDIANITDFFGDVKNIWSWFMLSVDWTQSQQYMG